MKGTFDLRLPDEERKLLEWLLPQLRELLVDSTPEEEVDRNLRRLFPTAYHEDAELDQEYRSLMHDDLLRGRLENIEAVERSLDATSLTHDEVNQWIAVVNDVRLVLGTRLDVSEEDDPASLDPDDPASGPFAVYHYLGWLLGEMVDVLLD